MATYDLTGDTGVLYAGVPLMTGTWNRSGTTNPVYNPIIIGSAVRARAGIQLVSVVLTDVTTLAVSYDRTGDTSVTYTGVGDGVKNIYVSGSTDITVTLTDAITRGRIQEQSTTVLVTNTNSIQIDVNRSAALNIRVYQGGWPEEALSASRVFFYFGGIDILPLPAPNCPDTEQLVLQTQVRHARNGTRYQYKRTPTYQILVLDFENIKFSELERIRDFFTNYAGQDLRYKDHHGQYWNGTILTDPVELKALCKYMECPGGREELYGFSLEFEGAME